MSEEENKGWRDRHFFSLNLDPQKAMPDDNPSTLPDSKTNPARYPDPEPGEAPTTPKDKESPQVEGAVVAGAAAEPFREPAPGGSGSNPPPSTSYPRPANPADPTKPPVGPVAQPTPGAPTVPTPEAAQREKIPAVKKTTPDA